MLADTEINPPMKIKVAGNNDLFEQPIKPIEDRFFIEDE